ncbi:MAG TPA: YwiC-like family protein [Thermoanaerobaculia bacterium]|nr:YwiC-like family protein [Thermoanaerobaculia bacterium]
MTVTHGCVLDHSPPSVDVAMLMGMERAVSNAVIPVSIRPLALPAEHGGWGFVLEPVALALLVAPSWAGIAIGIAVVAAFLARHSLRLAAGDWMRRRRFPRTAVCEQLVLIYSTAMLLAIATAMALTSARILVPFAIAAPSGLAQFAWELRKRGRALTPEILGAAAAGATAAAIALAGGRTMTLASTLWILTMLRSIPAIVFVRAVLKRGRQSIAVALHVAAFGIAIVLWRQHLAPLAAIVAMLMLLGRALIGPARTDPPRRVGIRELFYGAATVVLIGVGWS